MVTENNMQGQYDGNNELSIPTVITAIYDTEPPHFILKGLEMVRMRPGMYIGDVGVRGLHHLFKETLDNALDAVIAGDCTEIDVVLGADYMLTVSDNGGGIPINIIPESGKNGVEHVFTELTFRNHINLHSDNYPKVAGALRGAGASVVNALSDWLVCEVKRDSRMYRMRFERGIPTTPLEAIGECGVDDHGTKVTWLADKTMFTPALTETGELAYDSDWIVRICREAAYQLPKARITFHDQLHSKPMETFRFPNGIVDYVRDLNQKRAVFPAEPIAISGVVGNTQVEVALQYSDCEVETILGFTNTTFNPENGKHITGFRHALTKAVNGIGGTRTKYTGETIRRGLTAVVSVFLTDPKFNPSDRSRLDSPEVEGIVFSIVYKGLKRHFTEYPDQKNAIVERVIANTKAQFE